MKTSKAGFSLVEIIVVLGILAVLAALLFPVLANARSGATKTTELARLRSIWQATMLYTGDYDSAGTIIDQLPLGTTFVEMAISRSGFYGIKMSMLKSSCRKHPQIESPSDVLSLPADEDSKKYYNVLYTKYGDILPLAMNFNCNDSSVNLRSIYTTKTGFAALLNGTAIKKQARGPANDIMFWTQ